MPALHFQLLRPSSHYDLAPLAPWQAEKWADRGEQEFKAGNAQAARRIFEVLLLRQPDQLRASNDLACVLWQTDADGTGAAEAKRILEQVLERAPDNEDARWNLAEIEAAEAEVCGV